MKTADKLSLCAGCHDDFYNGKNHQGIKECWSLEQAKKVQRWRIHWWTPQDRTENFTRVTTLDCHHEPGQYQYSEQLPETRSEREK